MFNRATLALLAATVIATPAVARFEDEAEYEIQIADYLSDDVLFLSDTVCSHPLETGQSASISFMDDTLADGQRDISLLMRLTGIAPQTLPQTSASVVACN